MKVDMCSVFLEEAAITCKTSKGFSKLSFEKLRKKRNIVSLTLKLETPCKHYSVCPISLPEVYL